MFYELFSKDREENIYYQYDSAGAVDAGEDFLLVLVPVDEEDAVRHTADGESHRYSDCWPPPLDRTDNHLIDHDAEHDYRYTKMNEQSSHKFLIDMFLAELSFGF